MLRKLPRPDKSHDFLTAGCSRTHHEHELTIPKARSTGPCSNALGHVERDLGLPTGDGRRVLSRSPANAFGQIEVRQRQRPILNRGTRKTPFSLGNFDFGSLSVVLRMVLARKTI
jgi:hypothetical protein